MKELYLWIQTSVDIYGYFKKKALSTTIWEDTLASAARSRWLTLSAFVNSQWTPPHITVDGAFVIFYRYLDERYPKE